MTIFLATDLTAGEATPMEDERIQTRWFSAAQVEKMILSNKIQDAKTMIGYFVWKNGKR
jgi:ADP-ribose pyrophosphatase